MALALAAAALGGLMIGSFLNVVAYRLPRGESLVTPGSRCPGCEHPVRPYDNVPVLSWLVLRGRCRDCGEPISARYPIVEALTGALYVAVVVLHHDDVTQVVLGLVLVTFLVPLTLIDLETLTLPDRLTAPAAVLGLVLGTALDPGGEVERLIAAGAAGAFFFVAWYVKPGGMGFGDVKLVAVLGLFLGRNVGVAVFAALLTGVVVGLVIMRRVGVATGRKAKVPFGPFLALGGVVAVLAGDALVDAYVGTF
jgi:leader peptidase (prepilin peptidase) / N-methyltransferase